MKTLPKVLSVLSLGLLTANLAFAQYTPDRTFTAGGAVSNETVILKVSVQGDHGVDGNKYDLPSAVYYKISAKVGLEDDGTGKKDVNFYDVQVKPLEFSGEFGDEVPGGTGTFNPLHIEVTRDRSVGQEMRARIHLLSGGFALESRPTNILGASLLAGIGGHYLSMGKFKTTDGIEDVDTFGAFGNAEINGHLGVRLRVLEGLLEAVLMPIEFERALLSNSDWKDSIQNSLSVNVRDRLSLFVVRSKRTYGMNKYFIPVPDESQFADHKGVSNTRWEVGASLSVGKRKKKGKLPKGYE